MQLLDRMTLKRKLFLTIAMPFLGLALVAADGLRDRIDMWRTIQAAASTVKFSHALNAYLHVSRVERGSSVLFLLSPGARWKEEMANARRLADEKRTALYAMLDTAMRNPNIAVLAQDLRAARGALEQMDVIRAQVDRQEGGSAQAVLDRYGDLHARLMEIRIRLIEMIADVELANMLRAQDDIDHVQELLGIERVLLGEALTLKKIGPEPMQRLVAVISEQNFHEDRFLRHAPETIARLYHEKMRAACAVQADEMRSSALNSIATGRYEVDAQHWFTQATCKISSLDEVEDRQHAESDALLSAKRAKVTWAVALFFGLAVMGGLVSLWLVGVIIRTGVRRISQLAAAMQAFGAGDMDRQITVESDDELGQLAKEFNDLSIKVRYASESMQEMAQREAQASALLREMLARALTFIEAVARGDLAGKVSLQGSDDLVRLGVALDQMARSLAGIAQETNMASHGVSVSVAQLQNAIDAQSAGAAEQAAAVNETTATLEEIRATSAQTLAKTQQLGETAERARREGEQGLQAVGQAVSGMGAIRERMENIAQTILALSEQIQQIGEITGVVTGLAQQSKMLALNASIEAAKAGEAGKGFAVVAAEVKELAEQSQQSTAQVQKILQDIRHATDRAVMATEEGNKGVDAGVVLVQKSGEAVKALSEVIREAALASQQIVAAVRQEAAGIDQVTTAMSEINKVTGQFVDGTRQTKSAAMGLTELAEKLKTSVSLYKL